MAKSQDMGRTVLKVWTWTHSRTQALWIGQPRPDISPRSGRYKRTITNEVCATVYFHSIPLSGEYTFYLVFPGPNTLYKAYFSPTFSKHKSLILCVLEFFVQDRKNLETIRWKRLSTQKSYNNVGQFTSVGMLLSVSRK